MRFLLCLRARKSADRRLEQTVSSASDKQDSPDPGSSAASEVDGLSGRAGGGAVLGPQSRRNYVLGVLNGMIGTAAYDFLHPDLILAGLVFTLARPESVFGESWAYYLVALLSIINKGGSLLPQLYVSSYLEHRALKRPFYIALTYVRGFGAASLLAAIWWLGSGATPWTMALFFVAWLVISLAMGAGFPVTMDMFGRMIQIDRIGSFLGTREFLGGALSLVAGLLVVQPILNLTDQSGGGPALAYNYFWLGAIGSILTVLSMGLLILCHEEPGPRAKRRTTLTESLIRGWRWVKRNPDYRAYLWLRIAFRVNDLGMAFFIPYGKTKLERAGSGTDVVLLGGLLVATFKLSRVASSALWGWMVDRHGDRAALVGTGVCFMLGPMLALLAPMAPGVFAIPLPLTGETMDLPLAIYLAALVAIGAAYQGSIIGGNRFLIGRAPPRRRLSYIGFLNTVTSPLTLLPILAAVVAAELGVTALFVAIVGGGVLYLLAALRVRPDAHTYAGRRRQSPAAAAPEAGP